MAAHEKPPPPVVVVMVLAGTLSVALFAFAVVGFFLSSWVFILVAGLALFLGLSIVQGLWRGWRGSRIFAIGMGAAGGRRHRPCPRRARGCDDRAAPGAEVRPRLVRPPGIRLIT
jgi:hypothetical protein